MRGSCPTGLLHNDCPRATARVQVQAAGGLIAIWNPSISLGSQPFPGVRSRGRRRPPAPPASAKGTNTVWPAPEGPRGAQHEGSQEAEHHVQSLGLPQGQGSTPPSYTLGTLPLPAAIYGRPGDPGPSLWSQGSGIRTDLYTGGLPTGTLKRPGPFFSKTAHQGPAAFHQPRRLK